MTLRRRGSGFVFLALASPLLALDWPQWRGPARDGISQETGWTAQWPAAGPKQLWKASVGTGLSGVSVAQGRLYTMGNDAEIDTVVCLDAVTGKVVWKHSYPCDPFDPNGYPGPRCTPTVDGDRVYTVSRLGHLFCFDAASGKVIWAKELPKAYRAKPPKWGFAGSPLIEGKLLLLEVGAKGAALVALDKATGNEVWKAGDDAAGYSSPVTLATGDTRVVAMLHAKALVGRRVTDGVELWRHPWKTDYDVNAATPIVAGDRIFISSGYGHGGALLQLGTGAPKVLWENKAMRNQMNACVLIDGHLYGFDEKVLTCLDFNTGAVKWTESKYGKGSLMAADGKLILLGDRGLLGTAQPTPAGYREIASAQVIGGKDVWTVPVLANGRIYVRSKADLVAVDVGGR